MPIDEDKILDYHNSFVKQVALRENFENNGADGVVKNPFGWSLGTGSFKIGESITNNIGSVSFGDKYMECETAGTIGIPSEQAYGTWEFDWYKKIDATYFSIYFASEGKILYPNAVGWVIILGNQDVQLYRSGTANLKFSTNGNYSSSTWYRMKITRTTDGEFTVYMKGGSIGAVYTLIGDLAYGTNPITDTTNTESNTFLLNISAGDRIANIKIQKGVII